MTWLMGSGGFVHTAAPAPTRAHTRVQARRPHEHAPEGDEHADHLDELERDHVLGPLEEPLRVRRERKMMGRARRLHIPEASAAVRVNHLQQ